MSELSEYLEVALFAAPAAAEPPLVVSQPNAASFELLRAHEAAKIIKVSTQTVYRWMQTGALKSFRVGRVTRVRRCDLDQFILNNLTQ